RDNRSTLPDLSLDGKEPLSNSRDGGHDRGSARHLRRAKFTGDVTPVDQDLHGAVLKLHVDRGGLQEFPDPRLIRRFHLFMQHFPCERPIESPSIQVQIPQASRQHFRDGALTYSGWSVNRDNHALPTSLHPSGNTPCVL